MVKLLRRLVKKLGDTLDAWERFYEKDIGFFLLDNELPTADFLLRNSVHKVDKNFRNLRDILKNLRQLETALLQDSPQGVSDSLLVLNLI